MSDELFSYLVRISEASDGTGWFPTSELVKSDDDHRHLTQARARKWVTVEAYNCRITEAGRAALLSEQEKRDQESNQRAAESRRKPFVILGKVAKWFVGVVAAALITQFVSSLFQ